VNAERAMKAKSSSEGPSKQPAYAERGTRCRYPLEARCADREPASAESVERWKCYQPQCSASCCKRNGSVKKPAVECVEEWRAARSVLVREPIREGGVGRTPEARTRVMCAGERYARTRRYDRRRCQMSGAGRVVDVRAACAEYPTVN